MIQRRKGRECALQILFQLDSPQKPGVVTAIEGFFAHFEGPEDVRDFASSLVEGVTDHQAEIDPQIEAHSTKWKLARMDKVDRNLLRLATYELMFCPKVPTKVILDEAIEVAKRFGSEHSSAFVNGILDSIAKAVRKA